MQALHMPPLSPEASPPQPYGHQTEVKPRPEPVSEPEYVGTHRALTLGEQALALAYESNDLQLVGVADAILTREGLGHPSAERDAQALVDALNNPPYSSAHSGNGFGFRDTDLTQIHHTGQPHVHHRQGPFPPPPAARPEAAMHTRPVGTPARSRFTDPSRAAPRWRVPAQRDRHNH